MPAGESVTFDCLPQAWPEPQIQWRRNGRLLDLNELRLFDGNIRYSITRLAQTDFTNSMQNEDKLSASKEQMASIGSQKAVDFFGSRLEIRQVDKSDEGNYSCLVETKGSHRILERESPSAMLLTYGELHKNFIIYP